MLADLLDTSIQLLHIMPLGARMNADRKSGPVMVDRFGICKAVQDCVEIDASIRKMDQVSQSVKVLLKANHPKHKRLETLECYQT